MSCQLTGAVDRPREAFAQMRRMTEQHGLKPEPAGRDAVRYRCEGSEAVILRGAGSLGIRIATGDSASRPSGCCGRCCNASTRCARSGR